MESTLLTRVEPCRPVAPYIGGKKNLARRLTGIIDTVPHRTYAETFVGMGGVFLRRRSRPKAELINDWSRDIANFYRVLQEHYEAFVRMLRFQLTSRDEFDRLMASNPDTLTDLRRAARFLFLQRVAFGGKVAGRNFGMDSHRPARFDVLRLEELLGALHRRLAGVVIERLPWAAFMARYDTPDTLFYLDPPYWGSEDDYGTDLFDRSQFDQLVEVLARLKGRFILSINATPETRALFGRFTVEDVQTHYSIAAGSGARPAAELIVSN